MHDSECPSEIQRIAADALSENSDGESRRLDEFAAELRRWWRFDNYQIHTHSWHDRENFIERRLPELLSRQ